MFNVSSMLERRGHQIVPFAMKHENNKPTIYSNYFIENIDYDKVVKDSLFKKIWAGLKSIYSLEARNKLLKLLEKENPDLAHIHKISNTLTPSILYALRKRGLPIVQTLHDYRIICPNYNLYDPNRLEICEACKGHRYFNAVKRRCQKSSYLVGLNVAIESYLYHLLGTYENTISLFICPSNFLMKKVIEFGIDKKRVIWIPHFVKCDAYTPNYTNSSYILYFGRVEKHKGVETLIQAMKNVSDLKLNVVGEGSYRAQIERYARKHNIRNVAFLGYVTESRLIDLIRDCLFTIVPSEWYEPFGFTVLESFALGKPVVGANVGGIPELIKTGYNGMTFNSGDVYDLTDKINYLAHDKDVVLRMGKNARRMVEEKYSENIHYDKLIDAYKKVT